MYSVRMLRAPLRTVHFAAFSASTLLRYELHRRAVRPDDQERLINAYKVRTAHHALRILGVRVRRCTEVPKSSGPRLVVANHRTALDVGVLLSLVGGSFLSRGDLAEWPIVGRMARHADTIFVDRGSSQSGARAIRAIRSLLKEGQTVIAFPEGATYVGDEVRPFRGGVFAAARGLPVEVLPVGLAYPSGVEYVNRSFATHVREVASRRATPVSVAFGTPMPADLPAKSLAARAEESVRQLVTTARAAHGGVPI